MRQFSKEDYKLVKDYEKDFETAIKSRYCTGLSQKEIEDVHAIYTDCFGYRINTSCGSCVLRIMTSVGRLYFAFKDTMKKKKK